MGVVLVVLAVVALEVIYWFGRGYIRSKIQRRNEDRLDNGTNFTEQERLAQAAQRWAEHRREEAKRLRQFTGKRRAQVALEVPERRKREAKSAAAPHNKKKIDSALTAASIRNADDQDLQSVADVLLLKAASDPENLSITAHVDMVYAECLRRKRADIWASAKRGVSNVFETTPLPSWVVERERAVEHSTPD